MRLVSGEVVVSGRLAYVPQQPWIVSASLRDNILLGADFDQARSVSDSHSTEGRNNRQRQTKMDRTKTHDVAN